MPDVEQDADSLLARYRTAGVLIDTNLLLLYFVGHHDQGLIERWGRTGDRFVTVDFHTLLILLERVERMAVTPHVLTEVSNLLGGLYGHAKRECLGLLAHAIDSLMHEKRTPGYDLIKDPAFTLLGITDTSILDAAAGTYLVLTDDFDLYVHLQGRGVDVLNFNQVRELAY